MSGYQPRGAGIGLGNPPNQGSGAKRPNEAATEKAAWIALAATALLVAREISGRASSVADAADAVDIACRVYDETVVVCDAAPTKAL